MRKFDDKELEIIRILSNSNGLKFDKLLLDKLSDCKLIVNFKSKKTHIRYKTEHFHPTPKEEKSLNRISNELHERVYLAVTITNYFESEGFIGLFRNSDRPDKIEIGDTNIQDLGVLTEVKDETINELLVNYIDKTIIITQSFKEFVKNNYVFDEDLKHKQVINFAKAGIIVAILIGVFSILLTFYFNFNQQSSQKNESIYKDSLFNKIDSVIFHLKKIENFKNDSNETK